MFSLQRQLTPLPSLALLLAIRPQPRQPAVPASRVLPQPALSRLPSHQFLAILRAAIPREPPAASPPFRLEAAPQQPPAAEQPRRPRAPSPPLRQLAGAMQSPGSSEVQQ